MSLANITPSVTLDIYDHNLTPSSIKTIALDSNTRFVAALIRNRGEIYDIGQDAAVALTVLRPDKTRVQITGETYSLTEVTRDDETITYYGASAELTQLALAIKGNLKAQFKITSGEQELRTEIFTINNGEALDAGDGDWAGDLDGHNLDEMAQSIEDLSSDVPEIQEDVSDLKEGLSAMSTATSSDVGKALKAKTVTEGKVVEWEFGTVGSPTDSALSPTSENAVQNKVLYNELNILTSSAEDVTYINADTETPGGYNGTACAIDIPIDGEAIIKSVDVRVKTGVTAKLGRWSFRPHSEQFPNRGYYKLEEILGTVVSSDTHAVFNLNNFEYDRSADILLVTTPANDIGYHLNVSNTINAIWMTSNDFNDVEVGSESTTIITHPTSGTIQGAFTVVYSQGGTVTATPVKSIVSDLDNGMTAIRTATAGDVGKALKAKTVTDGKVTEWEFGDAGGVQITVDDEISDVSENPVQNKVLYDELNIVKTETIVPTETTYTNGEIIQPLYNGYAVSVEIPETDDVVLKQVDIRVKTGVVAKLGIWTFRKHSDALPYRGYFTLSQLLGTVEAVDTHAVFNINDVSLDPNTQILMVTTGEQAIGVQTGMSNDLMPFVGTSSSNTMNSMAVGDETTTIYTWRYEGGNYGVQGAYSVTYEPAETKTVTTITNVKTAVDGLITDVADIKNNTETTADEMLRKPINKYFVVIVDDVTRDALTVADQLLAIGVRPAFALKMESMGVDISWAEVKQLQDMGFEICFHGMLHSRYNTAPDDDAIMIADISEYKALCKEHGIVLHGYAGPVHYPLPVGAFKEFEWARYPYGLQAYGAPNHLATTFASVSVYSADLANGQVPVADLIAGADNVGDNQYLTPMLHCQNLVAYLNDYLTVFNSWISAGLTPLRPMDAVKQSLFNSGGIGDNSTFEIQAGTATNPYFLIAGNGTVLSSNS